MNFTEEDNNPHIGHFWQMRKQLIDVKDIKGSGAAAKILRRVGRANRIGAVPTDRIEHVIYACKELLGRNNGSRQQKFNIPGLRGSTKRI